MRPRAASQMLETPAFCAAVAWNWPLGDSERIPHPDGRFNKVFSVHTIYF